MSRCSPSLLLVTGLLVAICCYSSWTPGALLWRTTPPTLKWNERSTHQASAHFAKAPSLPHTFLDIQRPGHLSDLNQEGSELRSYQAKDSSADAGLHSASIHQTWPSLPLLSVIISVFLGTAFWVAHMKPSPERVSLHFVTSAHCLRNPKSSRPATLQTTSSEPPTDTEDLEEEDDDDDWDPDYLPEGFQVVDIADDEIITLEQLEEWEATLAPDDPWPDVSPANTRSVTPTEKPKPTANVRSDRPLPFIEVQPTEFTEDGYAVVTDEQDHGMEVVYTMEVEKSSKLGLGLPGMEDLTDYDEEEDDVDNGWEVSGWTTGRQKGIKRSMEPRQDIYVKRPDLLALTARPKKAKRSKLPIIAVVGRPNVGKSTLVNRICDVAPTEGAITYDEVGVTRDRTYRSARFENYNFMVVDTGGLIFEDNEEYVFAKEIRQQALVALSECKVAIVVVDGMLGPNTVDEDIARLIQKDFLSKGIAVYLAVNKCEGESMDVDLNIASFWSLGLGEPRPVSGIHGTGLYELLEDICKENFQPTDDMPDDSTINVAIVGRPNVGKSSMLNRLLGQERAIVSDVAGTTRDAIDCELEVGENVFRLVDTAGLRQGFKVEEGNEFLMANRTNKAIARADVCLMLLDATAPGFVTAQDRAIAQRIVEAGVGCCLLVNKLDLYPRRDLQSYNEARQEIEEVLPDLSWATQLLVSAATGVRCQKILGEVLKADQARRLVIDVLELNDVIFAAMKERPPVSPSNKKGGRVYYTAQEGVKPPRIVVYVNTKAAFTENYRKYLERQLRQRFPLVGTPIQLVLESTRQRDAVKRCPPEIAQVIWEAVDTGKKHPYTALCT